MSKNYVKDDIIFFSIIKSENITVSDDEYAEGLAEYAIQQGVSGEELEEMYTKDYIRECLLWDKMMVYLASQNTFVE